MELPNDVHDTAVCLNVKIHGPEVAPILETIPSSVSAVISATINATSEMRSSPLTPTKTAPQKISSLNKNAKVSNDLDCLFVARVIPFYFLLKF